MSRKAQAEPKTVDTLPDFPTTTLGNGKEVRGCPVEYTDEEVWVPVKDWEDRYAVSSHGRIKALPRSFIRSSGWSYTRKEKVLKTWLNELGCVTFRLTEGFGDNKTRVRHVSLHILVAEHFLVPPDCPEKDEVNHKDGNRQNNHKDNLEWSTHQDNINHAVRELLLQHGEKHWNSKLTEADVKEIRRLDGEGYTCREIWERVQATGVKEGTILQVINKETWKWLKQD